MAARRENPFEPHRIHSRPVRGIGPLEHDKRGDRVQCKFEASVKKAGAVRSRQDPSIANAGVPYTRIFGPARNRVSAPAPHFDLMTTLLRTILCYRQTRYQQHR